MNNRLLGACSYQRLFAFTASNATIKVLISSYFLYAFTRFIKKKQNKTIQSSGLFVSFSYATGAILL